MGAPLDGVRGRDPNVNGAKTAARGLEDQFPLLGAGHARPPEQGGVAVESPDQPPGLGRGIGEDARGRRDLVAGRDVHASAVGPIAPIVEGTADLPFDHVPDRQIGAEMRAIGALHHHLALPIAVEDDARAEKIYAEHSVRTKLAREPDREPGLVKADAVRSAGLLTRGCAECHHLRHLRLLMPHSTVAVIIDS